MLRHGRGRHFSVEMLLVGFVLIILMVSVGALGHSIFLSEIRRVEHKSVLVKRLEAIQQNFTLLFIFLVDQFFNMFLLVHQNFAGFEELVFDMLLQLDPSLPF